MPEIVFKGKEYVYNHHLGVPYRPLVADAAKGIGGTGPGRQPDHPRRQSACAQKPAAARTQYGLQGWKRHKVYPDFVFGLVSQGAQQRMVLLETKGAHLGGNEDTSYKTALLQRLSEVFHDKRFQSVGELALIVAEHQTELACDLLLSPNWAGALEARWFAEA
jgi:hypothetical protein